MRSVAHDVGISASELSRIERGLADWASIVVLAELCAVVGLDLVARAYPGGNPIRDTRHGALLARFGARLHPSIKWATEVPLPVPGDQRAWDMLIRGDGWRYGVEAELNPVDGQALIRRLMLKARDGRVDGVLLLLPETRHARDFRREFGPLLAGAFPGTPAAALKRLDAGLDPGGGAVITI